MSKLPHSPVRRCRPNRIVDAISVGIFVDKRVHNLDKFTQLDAVRRHIQPVRNLLYLDAQINAQVLDPVIPVKIPGKIIIYKLKCHTRQIHKFIFIFWIEHHLIYQWIFIIVLYYLRTIFFHHGPWNRAD